MTGLDEHAVALCKFTGRQNAFTTIRFKANSGDRQNAAQRIAAVAAAPPGPTFYIAAK